MSDTLFWSKRGEVACHVHAPDSQSTDTLFPFLIASLLTTFRRDTDSSGIMRRSSALRPNNPVSMSGSPRFMNIWNSSQLSAYSFQRTAESTS